MFTVCPKCTLPLAVTAGDLRAGQGYVRCGRCANVFNALVALSEEPGSPAAVNAQPPEPAPLPLPEPEAPSPLANAPVAEPLEELLEDSQPLAENEPAPPAFVPAPQLLAPQLPASQLPATPLAAPRDHLPDAGTAEDDGLPDDPTLPDVAEAAAALGASAPPGAADAHGVAGVHGAAGDDEAAHDEVLDIEAVDQGQELHEFRGTGTYETIVLEGDGITQTEEVITEETPQLDENETDNGTFRLRQADETPATAAMRPDAPDPELAALRAQLLDESRRGVPPDIELAPLLSSSQRINVRSLRSAAQWPWTAATVVLALLLSAQAIHHWRNELAARPLWNAPLTAVYRELGVELSPEWDLGRYDVRQLGAATDATDKSISVRVSVANRSERDQPVPWLRLTLLNRFGKRVASRDLPPADFLPNENRGLRFLAPDQRVDSEIAVVDPGPDAASFEVDVCLPSAGGRVRCANDYGVLAASR